MKRTSIFLQAICFGLLVLNCSAASGQFKEDSTIRESISVLTEIMAIPATGIPRNMLSDAQAVAIIPNVIKGSFVIGARRGSGVVMVRDQNGGWHAPVFITLTGGNIGWQAGVQSSDVVLVFKTRRSVEGLLSGRFTLGADAAVAAGPIGRQAAAATDSGLGAQIYSYSRSRGLFAGVSFDGSVIRVDAMSNANYYRAATPGGPVIIPPNAQQLGMQVIQYTGNQRTANQGLTNQVTGNQVSGNQGTANLTTGNQAPSDSQVPVFRASNPTGPSILAQQHSLSEAEHIRDQLARLAPQLYEHLDAGWQTYLGLPAQVFQGNGHPSPQVLNQCLIRFDTVRNDQRYAALANFPEFESTYGLLKHYIQELSSTQQPLSLPAPPATMPLGSRQ